MNMFKKNGPCGSWPSPFTTETVAGKNVIFSELQIDEENIYWLERRPQEQNRTVLVQWNKNMGIKDITTPSFSVGNKVHEYGGGSYSVHKNSIVFSDLNTGGIWTVSQDRQATCLYQDKALRFASFNLIDKHVFCVCEDHSTNNVKNSLVLFSLDNPNIMITLDEKADFYSTPTLSKDQAKLAWIEWYHPFMPWESTYLCCADFDIKDKAIKNKRILAGNKQIESLIEPGWTENNQLYVCSDRENWWNLYHVNLHNDEADNLRAITQMNAEIGKPHWIFGQKNWYPASNNNFVVQAIHQGFPETFVISHNKIKKISLDQPEYCPVPIKNNEFAWINCSTSRPTEIIYQDNHHNRQVIQISSLVHIHKEDISIGHTICFPTQDHQYAYGFFYPPTNRHFQPNKNELPPLMVIAHGGPTGQTVNSYNPKIQFWTSRGFAVVDVNYRGSTGFGKTYRNALQKKWGILDVQDCIDACNYLIKQQKVDPKKIVIKGSSAGGFTVLSALVKSKIFAAGSCLYGVGDLTALAEETHKFESNYLNGLIGSYPEEKELYHERSPLTHIHQIACPLILFQGLKDMVVPPSQAENIIKVLKNNHIPHAYYTFKEEGHGFKQEATVKKVLELELAFFGKILGFKPDSISEKVTLHT